MSTKNAIVEIMPYVVTKLTAEGVMLAEARFRSISDAKDFCDLMTAKWPAQGWEVIFQFYNDQGSLLMARWGDISETAMVMGCI